MVSVVIPAYNESGIIMDTLDAAALVMDRLGLSYEIVVADDGSTDGTGDLVRQRDGGRFRLVGYPDNAGKGKAVRTGILAARGDRIICTDADLAYGTDIFAALLEALDSGADLAIGSRRLDPEAYGDYPVLRRIASGTFHRIAKAVSGLDFDTQCGIKAYRGDAAREIFSRCSTDGFAFDSEVLARAVRVGYRIDQVPARVVNFRESKVRLVRDSVRMFRDILRIRRMLDREVRI